MDRSQLLRILFVVLIYVVLVLAGQIAGDWALARLEVEIRPSTQASVHRMVMVAVVLYVILLALPFMPGVEIGLGLMVMLGPSICFLVYVSTVTALVIAFLIGRLLPASLVVAFLSALRLARAGDLVSRLSSMPMDERLAFLLSRLPSRSLGFLVRHRFIALAILFNLPGNAVIGGGGGIALAAGVSRLFGLPAFALTVALAVSPVPLAYYLFNN